MEPSLASRDELMGLNGRLLWRDGPVSPRRFACGSKALGLREAESRPLPAPQRGRTKHYYKEAAWDLMLLHRKTGGDYDDLVNELEPFREIVRTTDWTFHYIELNVPGWHDEEFAALMLFFASPDYGMNPLELGELVDEHPDLLDISSYGREFMSRAVDAYLSVAIDALSRRLKFADGRVLGSGRVVTSKERERRYYADQFFHHLAGMYEYSTLETGE